MQWDVFLCTSEFHVIVESHKFKMYGVSNLDFLFSQFVSRGQGQHCLCDSLVLTLLFIKYTFLDLMHS